jgi:hypothetical protein
LIGLRPLPTGYANRQPEKEDMTTILSTPTSMTISAPGTSALGTLAASMPSGDWKQLAAAGLGLFTGQGGSSGITGYATKFARDPLTGKMYYIGCDHGTANIFVQYDEATNAWTTAAASVPWGIGQGTDTDHGYEHITFDTLHGKLYRHVHATTAVRRWDGGTTWGTIDFSGTVNYKATTCGITFFPELGPNGSIVVFQSNGSSPNGIIFGIDPVTLARTTYANGGILNPAGETDQFCHYSPQQKCVVFGGGEIPRGTKVWKLSAAGVVTLISNNLPSNLGDVGPGGPGCSLPVINPKNGNLIVFQSASLSYDYDLTTGVWTQRAGTSSIWSANLFDVTGPVFGSFACPIPEYGVIAFIKSYSGSQPAQMWLHKP